MLEYGDTVDTSPDLSVRKQEPNLQTNTFLACLDRTLWGPQSPVLDAFEFVRRVCRGGGGELESLSDISSLSMSPGGGNQGYLAHISCLSPWEADWKSGLGGRWRGR